MLYLPPEHLAGLVYGLDRYLFRRRRRLADADGYSGVDDIVFNLRDIRRFYGELRPIRSRLRSKLRLPSAALRRVSM
jgi:hypothetical protein